MIKYDHFPPPHMHTKWPQIGSRPQGEEALLSTETCHFIQA